MIRIWDRSALVCLCLGIFCLPFSKAGLQVFIWLAVFSCLMKRAAGYRTSGFAGLVPATPLNTALLFFLLANVLATIFSPDQGLSSKALFGKVLKFVLTYFVVVETISSVRRLRIFLGVLLCSAALIAADACVQGIVGVDFLRGYRADRLTGPFLNPNDFGGWLIMLIPFFMGIVLMARPQVFSWKIRGLFAVVAMGLLVCLVATYTRGAWLGLLAGLFWGGCYFMGRLDLRARWRVLMIFGLLISTVVVFNHPIAAFVDRVGGFQARVGYTIGDRVRSLPNMKDKGIDDRINLWREALRIWRDHPLTGCGLNNYSIVARDYKSFSYGGIYPHNSFLQMLAETGVVGLGAFLWVLWVFFREGWRHVALRGDVLVLGALCAILGFLVQSFFDTNLYALPMVMLFWYMTGLTMAMVRIDAGGQKKETICHQK